MSKVKQRSFVDENPVSRMVTDIINGSDMTQIEIADAIGLGKSNVLTMFKQGRSPLPMKYVIPLCRVCGGDEEALMIAVLETYYPDILEAIQNVGEKRLEVEEKSVLKAWRKAKADSKGQVMNAHPSKFFKLRGEMKRIFFEADKSASSVG